MSAVNVAESIVPLSQDEFDYFQALVSRELGIFLPPHKQPLIVARLNKRLLATGSRSFSDYFKLIESGLQREERRLALELITTNETSFFREHKHFDFIRSHVLPNCATGRPLRIWSAASSSGEEAYSIAMTLAEYAQMNWQIYASDINTQVLAKAKKAIYPIQKLQSISNHYARKYCRKGQEEFSGFFRISPGLRERVVFEQLNLMTDFSHLGLFDVIFLRNVMIYFDSVVQSKLLSRITQRLRSGGYLFVGHAESLHGFDLGLRMIKPAVYQLME